MISSEYILESSKEFSIYTCENRAIPRVTDGLKSSQRKALWIIKNKAEKIKTASLAGEMMSANIYVHGDVSASDAISKMACEWLNNIPFIDGIGQFGSRVQPGGYGAPRYTSVKRSKFAENVIYKDSNLIPLIDNYDGSTKEPETFLPIIPIVLLNGVQGIAVGWSTSILPRSLKDIINGCIDSLQNKTIKKLKPQYTKYNLEIEELSKNKWCMYGKLEIVNTSTVKISELPPETKLDKFRELLDQYEDEGKITKYIDNSSSSIDITVTLKREFLKDKTEKELLTFFKMYDIISERIVVIDWNGKSIKQYDNPEDLIKDFTNWRFKYYIQRYEVLLKEKEKDLNISLAIKECYDKNLPNKLGKFENKKSLEDEIGNLTKKFNLSSTEIDKISNFPSYKWSKEYYDKLVNAIQELQNEISYIKDLLNNHDKIKNIYIDELKSLKEIKF